MSNDTVITLVGHLVADPDLRFAPSGRAVGSIRIASTPRYYDRREGAWKDGDTLFLTCTIWGQQGENAAESLERGCKVILRGRLKQRTYETREGERRTVFEVDVEDIGPALSNATAKVTKAVRIVVPDSPADLPAPEDGHGSAPGSAGGSPTVPASGASPWGQSADPWTVPADQAAVPPF